jgi:hypothetical protein
MKSHFNHSLQKSIEPFFVCKKFLQNDVNEVFLTQKKLMRTYVCLSGRFPKRDRVFCMVVNRHSTTIIERTEGQGTRTVRVFRLEDAYLGDLDGSLAWNDGYYELAIYALLELSAHPLSIILHEYLGLKIAKAVTLTTGFEDDIKSLVKAWQNEPSFHAEAVLEIQYSSFLRCVFVTRPPPVYHDPTTFSIFICDGSVTDVSWDCGIYNT